MDTFFVKGDQPQNTFTHVTIPGVILICIILLFVFYHLVLKKQFVQVAAGYQNPNPYAIRTGVGIRYHEQDQLAVGSTAGFQGGAEPPVYWGVSGSKELDDDRFGNRGAETTAALADASVAKATQKEGFTDEFLLNGPGKGR